MLEFYATASYYGFYSLKIYSRVELLLNGKWFRIFSDFYRPLVFDETMWNGRVLSFVVYEHNIHFLRKFISKKLYFKVNNFCYNNEETKTFIFPV